MSVRGGGKGKYLSGGFVSVIYGGVVRLVLLI